MQHLKRTAWAGMLGHFFLAGATFGVELIDDNREVRTAFDGGGNTLTPDPAFSPFVVNGQNTTVTSSSFSGSGSGYGESDFKFFIRESTFDVTFEALEPTDVDLSGSWYADNGDFGFARVTVTLAHSAGVLYSEQFSPFNFGPEEGPFGYTGTLNAGTYSLYLHTDITPSIAEASWNFTANFTTSSAADSDDDGVVDAQDNCTAVANPAQTDGDSDGFGNRCDADLNNDCVVNTEDLGLLRVAFFSDDPAADFNADGVVNPVDLGLMKAQFFGQPGPSGLASCAAAAVAPR